MVDYRSNADKRKEVIAFFQSLIKEFGSLEAIPKREWSDRAIAKHCGARKYRTKTSAGILPENNGRLSRWVSRGTS